MSGRRLAGGAWVAAGAALIAAILWGVRLSQGLDETTAHVRDLTAYLAQTSTELRSTRADADLLVDILGVLDDDSVRMMELEAVNGSGASGRLWAGVTGFVLLVRDLPPLPASRRYEVWIEAPPAPPTSGGTFEVNPFGRATVVRPGSVPADARILVTSEQPSGGAPGPAGPALLTGP